MQIFFSSYILLFLFGFLQKVKYIDIEAGKWLTQAYKSIFAYNGNEIVAFRAKKTSHQAKNDPILTKNSSKSTTLSEQFGCMPIIMKQFSTFFVFGLWYLILLIVV